ncbi:hypothetical protein [Zunongwangia sp. HRR-M8]|uniref:hypothetical protein n=1 Tax=Zunongwangia sp. HRR-M8 TaxID=3015170 RepID=UPI0022DD1467|nr:hypothetical protein [Zunongwangia sp. HRR-M8]WBL23831.1 hypothetical protein PBT89_07675 [Zunongwangia sp. HRR-M8]
MERIKKLYIQIREIAKSKEFLELRYINHLKLIYPLQNLKYTEWEKLNRIIPDLTQNEMQVIADSIMEIKNNKKSNFDTTTIYAQIFTLSDDLIAEYMLENFDFIDNDLPKRIELIDGLANRLKMLEGKTKAHTEFTKQYALINKLYDKAVC